MDTARFVPPAPEQVRPALTALVQYAAGEDLNPLIQCAVVHGQFEVSQPFDDGNGRIGRLLIPLFLFQQKQIHRPVFYLSEFLEQNREEYYDRLLGISRDGDWTGWISYFLAAIDHQARLSIGRIDQVWRLYEQKKSRIQELTRSQYAATVLDQLFKAPVFSVSRLVDQTTIEPRTANRLLEKLVDGSVLSIDTPGSGRQPSVYRFGALLDCVGADALPNAATK